MSDLAKLRDAVNALSERIDARLETLDAKVDKVLAAASSSGGGFPLIGQPNAGALAADADAQAVLAARWDSSQQAQAALDPINARTVESGGQVFDWGPDPDAPGKFRAFTNPSVAASGFFFQGPLYAAAKKAKDARPDTEHGQGDPNPPPRDGGQP